MYGEELIVHLSATMGKRNIQLLCFVLGMCNISFVGNNVSLQTL